ncbi:MAG: lactonase family protein [Caldilineaceae bacterium]|nr:lactonase family protein [Caldilineaceae bacterium]
MGCFAYIAIGGEDKLLKFEMDPESGELNDRREVMLRGGPGPLAVDPTQGKLYIGLRSVREIVSYGIDDHTGDLTPLGEPALLDADPCYLATDRTGRFLFSAYYGAGKVMVHPLHADGSVGQKPVTEIATAERAHCIRPDPSNRYVLVPHTAGPNLIFQFEFDAESGALTPNRVPKVVPPPGEGPRHYVYHPNQPVVYFSNEQGCSVTAYSFDAERGTLAPFQTLSTLPPSFDGANTCAQIHIHPTGRYLYVSNRGHDSIACFAVDMASGRLTSLGQQSTEPTPRVFGLDPAGNFLFAAGQGSGVLAAYRIDAATGLLDPIAEYKVGERPMWVMLLDLDR